MTQKPECAPKRHTNTHLRLLRDEDLHMSNEQHIPVYQTTCNVILLNTMDFRLRYGRMVPSIVLVWRRIFGALGVKASQKTPPLAAHNDMSLVSILENDVTRIDIPQYACFIDR